MSDLVCWWRGRPAAKERAIADAASARLARRPVDVLGLGSGEAWA